MSSILNDWNPVRPLLLLNMRRDLLWQFTKRNIQSGFRGSLLGVFWVVLSPLADACPLHLCIRGSFWR